MVALSPWVRRWMGRPRTDPHDRPRTAAPHRAALTVRRTQRLLNRLQRVVDRTVVWKPSVGRLNPARLQRFSNDVASRSQALQLVSARRRPAPALDWADSPELTLPMGPAPYGTGFERPTAQRTAQPGVFSVGQRIEPLRASPPSTPRVSRRAAPSRPGRRPPQKRELTPASRLFARVEEISPHGKIVSGADLPAEDTQEPEEQPVESAEEPLQRQESAQPEPGEAAPEPAPDRPQEVPPAQAAAQAGPQPSRRPRHASRPSVVQRKGAAPPRPVVPAAPGPPREREPQETLPKIPAAPPSEPTSVQLEAAEEPAPAAPLLDEALPLAERPPEPAPPPVQRREVPRVETPRQVSPPRPAQVSRVEPRPEPGETPAPPPVQRKEVSEAQPPRPEPSAPTTLPPKPLKTGERLLRQRAAESEPADRPPSSPTPPPGKPEPAPVQLQPEPTWTPSPAPPTQAVAESPTEAMRESQMEALGEPPTETVGESQQEARQPPPALPLARDIVSSAIAWPRRLFRKPLPLSSRRPSRAQPSATRERRKASPLAAVRPSAGVVAGATPPTLYARTPVVHIGPGPSRAILRRRTLQRPAPMPSPDLPVPPQTRLQAFLQTWREERRKEQRLPLHAAQQPAATATAQRVPEQAAVSTPPPPLEQPPAPRPERTEAIQREPGPTIIGSIQEAPAPQGPLVQRAEEEEEAEEIDLAELARRIYPLVKRLLAIERERMPGLSP
jgi:hypothetical protein